MPIPAVFPNSESDLEVLAAYVDAAALGAATVRNAAGVPSGAPTGTELPIAADTTASPATFYFWTGAA